MFPTWDVHTHNIDAPFKYTLQRKKIQFTCHTLKTKTA